jgi:hypothetical protein
MISLPSLVVAAVLLGVAAAPAVGQTVDETAGDGTTRRLSATNPETGVSVLGFLEQFRPRATSADCRQLYWTGFARRLDLKREDTRLFEQGDFAMVEYLIPDLQGTPINQKNLWIYFAKEGTCGYLHLSKPRFTAADEPLFGRILEGARIIARP